MTEAKTRQSERLQEVECVLGSSWPSDEGVDPASEFVALGRHFRRLGEEYTVIGALALAIHARPRCTRDLQIIMGRPPARWRADLCALGYQKHTEGTEGRVVYAKTSIRVTLFDANNPVGKAARANSRSYELFDAPLRVTEPNSVERRPSALRQKSKR